MILEFPLEVSGAPGYINYLYQGKEYARPQVVHTDAQSGAPGIWGIDAL